MTFQSKKSFFIRFSILFFWGALWHFLYSWSGNNILVGMIAPVNESVFEHLKLLFFPCLFLTLTEYFLFSRKQKDFFCARLCGVLLGMLTSVAIFSPYSGIIGFHTLVLDLIDFALGVLVFLLVSQKMSDGRTICPRICLILWVVAAAVMIILTFYPPHIPLFHDPVTLLYGIA